MKFYYFFSILKHLKQFELFGSFKFSIENRVSAPYFKIFEYSRLC